MSEKIDKIDELNKKYANPRYDSIELAMAYAYAKKEAISARQDWIDKKNGLALKDEVNVITQDYDFQRVNPNQVSSLDGMESLNFNNLLEVLEQKEEELNKVMLDKDIDLDAHELEQIKSRAKGKKFVSLNKKIEDKKREKERKKDVKEKDLNLNKQFVKQNFDKNKSNEIDLENEIAKGKEEDKKEYGLENEFKSKSIELKEAYIDPKTQKTVVKEVEQVQAPIQKKSKAISFDDKLNNAKLTSRAGNMMLRAASITHNTGRKVEFTINSKEKIHFEKIDGDTYAYKNGKQLDKAETIDALKSMLRNLDRNQAKNLEKIVRQVEYNPAIRDISKDIDKRNKTLESKKDLVK